MHDLHDDIRWQIEVNNDNYKFAAYFYKQLQEFALRDEVMVRVRPERFPPGIVKKIHAQRIGPHTVLRRFGSNTYKLEIPESWEFIQFLTSKDLILYCTPVSHSIIISDPPSSTSAGPQPFSIAPTTTEETSH